MNLPFLLKQNTRAWAWAWEQVLSQPSLHWATWDKAGRRFRPCWDLWEMSTILDTLIYCFPALNFVFPAKLLPSLKMKGSSSGVPFSSVSSPHGLIQNTSVSYSWAISRPSRQCCSQSSPADQIVQIGVTSPMKSSWTVPPRQQTCSILAFRSNAALTFTLIWSISSLKQTFLRQTSFVNWSLTLFPVYL